MHKNKHTSTSTKKPITLSQRVSADTGMQPSRSNATSSRQLSKRKSKPSLSQPKQTLVSAKPTPASKKVTAETSMQPSTSHTTPPQKLSSALGLGPKSRIHINGFLSAGGASTNTSADYLVPSHGTIDNHFNFAANSLIGLQFTADLARSLQVVTQFVADGDDTNGNVAYRVNAEWAYLRYSVTPGFQVRTGRFRLPAFLYSETQQVGYSYPWVQLPNEVYRIVPFENLNGLDFIYRYTLGQSGWTLMAQPFYGANSNSFTIFNAANVNGITLRFKEEDLKGIVASVGNSSFTLRGTYADLKLTGFIPGGPTLFSSDSTEYYSVGMKWTIAHHLLLISEYADRETPSQIASLIGYYGTIGYRLGKFTPIFTYARIKTTNADRLTIAPLTSERPQDQQSYTLGFDYTFNSNMDIKASIAQIAPLNGTFGLFTSDPGRRHITLYGVSLNAIF